MFRIIRDKSMKEALKGVRRQYLVGQLKDPQALEHLTSDSLEIGLTQYDDFMSEEPHKHSEATEYQYMVSGRTQYLDLDTGETHEFLKGDFYAIDRGTSYAQKSKPGTTILFIKIPSINDKIPLNADAGLRDWLDNKLSTVRKDFFYDSNAPKANSIKPAAAVAIVREGAMLMLKRADSGNWTMPGGTLEFGENLVSCAIREVEEECGIKVDIVDIIGTYTDPNVVVAYSDGEVRQEFTLVYLGRTDAESVTIDNESLGFRWVPLGELSELQMARSQKKRVDAVLDYLASGKKCFY